MLSSPLFRPVALGMYLLFFMVGMAGALVLPTFSLFLAKEIAVRPLLIGLVFAGIALTSIAYNHWIGRWSDRLSDRRPLVAGFCALGAVACLILAFSRHYAVVATTAVLIFSLSMVSFSQIMAYSLDYAEAEIPTERIPLFNAIMRAQIAFAWVAGPPLGFLLATYFSFTLSYSVAAGLYLLVGLMSLRLLPQLERRLVRTAEPSLSLPRLPPAVVRSLWFCTLGFSLLWGANNAYLISLPIHLNDYLQLDPHWMGWIMGTTAALEVPFMLLAGHYASRFRLVNVIRCAGVSALCLYLGIYFASALWHLFVLQVFNAMFIGLLAGIGVSVIQDLMPGRSGSASALYTNTTHIGSLCSSLVVGLVADYFGYHQVFLVNTLMVLLALWAFSKVKSARELSSPVRQSF